MPTSAPLERSSRIYVAGHRGLVGSAILAELRKRGYANIVTRTHAELDLTDAGAVHAFFRAEQPEYVFLAAARVGGILANSAYPADFIAENLKIQTSVIEACHRARVRRLLFLGSSCIYPRDCPQPIRESSLLTGVLEPTNRSYALAKIAGIEMCWAYNRQHGTAYLAAMPTNLYGPNDNFDLTTAHVLPALLRKIDDARRRKLEAVSVWGTGTPRREFLYAGDMAAACVFLMELDEPSYRSLLPEAEAPLINIGAGQDIPIRELAQMICEILKYPGRLVFDASKPDGTPRKLLDGSRLRRLGWTPKIALRDGIRITWESARAGWAAGSASDSLPSRR